MRRREKTIAIFPAAVVALSLVAAGSAGAQVSITTTTQPATSITAAAATLNGTVNGNGEDISAVYFDWGPTLPYAQTFVNANPFNVTAGQGAAPVTLALSGLTCGTTYHFRVTADDSNGRNGQGADMTFATAACVVRTQVPVPTLSEWSFIALVALVGMAAWGRLRRDASRSRS